MATRALSLVVRRELFAVLSDGAGVTVVSAPAGSGKTVLLRSWLEEAGIGDRAGWVSVEHDEREGQRFWLSVIDALRGAADSFVEPMAATPDFDGDAVVERLVSELAGLDHRVVLVIDDLHELHSRDAQRQLELLLARRPPSLRVVLASRRDPRLGLHRLRLAGDLTEIRGADLRFTVEETRELLSAGGVSLSEQSLARLHERTEGWAAGVRLAALALAVHVDPEQFVAEFSGSERTVADYLLAEVLEAQSEEARRLLLRTSILARVNGALGDALTGGSGAQRILQDLERENAFVISTGASRSWFRYHRLFAEMLRLELERTEPETVPGLHRAAAEWYEAHEHVIDAIRHAQAAGDWRSATRLLADRSYSLWLDGRGTTVYGLLALFPAGAASSDAELAGVFASAAVWRGSLDDAAAYIAIAERSASQVSGERRPRFEVGLSLTRLRLASRRGDFTAALAEAEPLLAAEAATRGEAAISTDTRTAALMHLGIVELWSNRIQDAERRLQEGLELAALGARPYLQVQCLSHLAVAAGRRSLAEARERAEAAIAIAQAHGWGADRVTGLAMVVLATIDVWQGRFAEADQWLEKAVAVVRPELEPATGALLHVARGRLHGARAEHEQAAAEFRAGALLEAMLVAPQLMTTPARRLLARTQVLLGDIGAARATVAELPEGERTSDMTRLSLAYADLADGNARAAADGLATVLDGSAPSLPLLLVEAHLLDAAARDRLGETEAAESDVERALELAEHDRLIWPFVATPSRALLERHAPHRTAHGGLVKDILDVLAGSAPSGRPAEPDALDEDLSKGELRVLRYLPSNLSMPEIAGELFLSPHTVATHVRHIYAKLGVHRRSEAVERARELGLLAPPSRLR